MEADSRPENSGFFRRPLAIIGPARRSPYLVRISHAQELHMSDSSADFRHADGRFAKGHPGGPGRPRNPVSTAAQDLDRLGVEVAQELMGLIVEKARQGNLKAAEMVLQRVWPLRRNRPIELEIPGDDAQLPNLLAEHAHLAMA